MLTTWGPTTEKTKCQQYSLLFSCSALSESLWPQGLQHARLPETSKGKACPALCLLQSALHHTPVPWRPPVKIKVVQSRPTLCDPMDYTVHGILQARILEWVAFPFSRGFSQPRDRTQVSCIAGRFFAKLSHKGSPRSGVGSLSFLQRIFPTQESNWSLLHCRGILYQAEPQGKPKNTGVGSLSLLQRIFPTQESNWSLLHCRQILNQLNYEGSPSHWIIHLIQMNFILCETRDQQLG